MSNQIPPPSGPTIADVLHRLDDLENHLDDLHSRLDDLDGNVEHQIETLRLQPELNKEDIHWMMTCMYGLIAGAFIAILIITVSY